MSSETSIRHEWIADADKYGNYIEGRCKGEKGKFCSMEKLRGAGKMISSAEEFVRLRDGSNPEEYRRAAVDSASEQVWLDVINNYPEERVWVAQNKTVPMSILKVLATDSDARVRFMVAMKRKLTSDLLDILSFDSDESIRLAVARHKSTSNATLEVLHNDEWEEVRVAAGRRLNRK